MPKIKPAKSAPDVPAPHLDRRYGKIGISAVAAALPYQSEMKNPAYAPVPAQANATGGQEHQWTGEIAA